MRRTEGNTRDYTKRLEKFLKEIDEIASLDPRNNPMHQIMDTVPFKDLETALMMAKLERGTKRQAANV